MKIDDVYIVSKYLKLNLYSNIILVTLGKLSVYSSSSKSRKWEDQKYLSQKIVNTKGLIMYKHISAYKHMWFTVRSH